MTKKPFALIILDGFGYREASAHNPTRTVETPTLDSLFSAYPHLLIEASGEAVGLPKGQMGNSEVGHLHIGAGRKLSQDLVRINNDIKSGVFYQNPVFLDAIAKAKKNNAAIHVIGLLSDGGVHSYITHIDAIMQLLSQQNVKHYLHAISDGRDTLPKSILNYINKDTALASIMGRYYAMDRDKRWERTEKAFAVLTNNATALHFPKDGIDAVKQAYARGETDEFISPVLINPDSIIRDNDVVIVMNFRADRARQLTQLFLEKKPSVSMITLTEYLSDSRITVAYPPLNIKNTLGEYLSKQHLTQLRLAETEKYAHITYFLNGGIETPYPGEDRQLIPSPKIATYDLQPAMSAIAITDALVSAIENRRYDVIFCNYANLDMIGHTGKEKAAEEAVVIIDACIKRVLDALKKVNGEAIITADHGNIELMFDEKTGQPHTAHTTNLVPFIYIGKSATVTAKTGALDDIAPTLLYLMGLEKPAEMTGHPLIKIEG